MIQFTTLEFLGFFLTSVSVVVFLIIMLVVFASANNKNYRRYTSAQKELETLRAQRWQDLMNTTKQ
jgi:uncharacterized membrane protein YbaN (DUF454 family)